jgi:hypothetical protein
MNLQISREDVLMGRDEEYPMNSMLEDNLHKLLICLNMFQMECGLPMKVTSGYRPGHYNSKAVGSKNSAHLVCEACDFDDRDHALKDYVEKDPGILERCGLYMEHPGRCRTWIHLQSRPTRNRIFEP